SWDASGGAGKIQSGILMLPGSHGVSQPGTTMQLEHHNRFAYMRTYCNVQNRPRAGRPPRGVCPTIQGAFMDLLPERACEPPPEATLIPSRIGPGHRGGPGACHHSNPE